MTCELARVVPHDCHRPNACLRAVIAVLTPNRPRDERQRNH